MIFPDRLAAGRLLADRLKHLSNPRPVVLALPRGGVPIGAEIAKVLDADLDILLVKRVIFPQHPELAIGAVSEGGVVLWQKEIMENLKISPQDADLLADDREEAIVAQGLIWRKDRKPINVAGRAVILVDDGLATGSSMMVAVETLKKRGPIRIIVAVPVASSSSVAQIRHEVDELLVLSMPDTFYGVGQWYQDFSEVSDEEVANLLRGGTQEKSVSEEILIPDGLARLPGVLTTVPVAKGLIIFAHGSASTHRSPRNQRVAQALNRAGFSTLLFDLLTEEETGDRKNVFDINLLAGRLSTATEWTRRRLGEPAPAIGYFGASTGGAAAIAAAADNPGIASVVSRGGRPDLAGEKLERVKAPVLLIVGGADHPTIPLNVGAAKLMAHAKVVSIPGATHLFEEPGALEEVAEYAISWFTESLSPTGKGAMPSPHEKIAQDLLKAVKPYRPGKDVDAWFEKVGQARVVMLGESTHGTQEFYETRKTITERLVKDYGFNFVAVEGDWPDCYRLTDYIRSGRRGKTAIEVLSTFQRWPTWLWNNAPAAALIESLKKSRTPIYGLDLYSMYESIEAIRNSVGELNPNLARHVQAVYSCFEPFQRSETEYARKLMQSSGGCEREIVELLGEILRTRIAEVKLAPEDFFNARRNATTIRNAERYYRAMVYGGPESWNIRDSHMMDTLDALLLQHGDSAKAVVWAHNTHIGDYHATDMLQEGYVNLGGLARERYGADRVHLVGFGTYEGSVLAAHAWGAAPESMTVPAAIPGSYDHYLHQAAKALGAPTLILPDLGTERLPSLSVVRGQRAVGVVYQNYEGAHHRNYVPSNLARRYDSFIFVDQTTVLKDLSHREFRKGRLPETWPSGM